MKGIKKKFKKIESCQTNVVGGGKLTLWEGDRCMKGKTNVV